jgi:hypothetical protein
MNVIILKGAALRQPPLPQNGPRAKTIAHPCPRRWQLSVTVLSPLYFNSIDDRLHATSYTHHAGTTTTSVLPCLKGVSNYVCY